jgi:hypothetical protein
MGEVKEKIMEVKRRNRWNRERDVKERYVNFTQIIKGKLEQTTPRKKKNKQNKTSELEDKEKHEVN